MSLAIFLGRAGPQFPNRVKIPLSTDQKQNTLDQVSYYNNFCEFGI